MKSIKRGLAVILAALLMIPTQPIFALQPTETSLQMQQEKDILKEAEEKEDEEESDNSFDSENDMKDESEDDKSSESDDNVKTEDEFDDEKESGDEPYNSESEDENLSDNEENKDSDMKEEEESESDGQAENDSENKPEAGVIEKGSNTDEAEKEALSEEENKIEDEIFSKSADEIIFNTGNMDVTVVDSETFYEGEEGDACFEEDGSYTINIPEENPFFPYEVEFIHDGKTTREWFMTPDDSVEIGGHEFYVSAYFDDNAVTGITLNVAGEKIVVYPEKKHFTNGGGGISTMSLLPLEEVRLAEIDLTDYTPVELTMVSVDSIFTGSYELTDDDSIMWTIKDEDDYKISHPGDYLDLSLDTAWREDVEWEMIVGDESQLGEDNIRYIVPIQITESRNWLVPEVYMQGEDGSRTKLTVASYEYYDSERDERHISIELEEEELNNADEVFVAFSPNNKIYPLNNGEGYRAFEGKYDTVEEAEENNDIVEQFFADSQKMEETDGGYRFDLRGSKEFTITSYKGEIPTGCLPFTLDIYVTSDSNYLSTGLYSENTSVISSSYSFTSNGFTESTIELKAGYPSDDSYNLIFRYYREGSEANNQVTAAYVGQFDSIADAESKGAEDIMESLFAGSASGGGYNANYSNGVYFTVFVGEDSDPDQEIYKSLIKTKAYEVALSSDTLVSFTGIKDSRSYVIDSHEDSYAEYNYITILTDEEDLSDLALEFSTQAGINLYTEGSDSPEESGVNTHDFSDGPVQYSASAENKEDAKNYWVQIINPEAGDSGIYINSFADEDAETVKDEDGTITSVREVFIDSPHDNLHDIVIINRGTEDISNLSVELDSEALELDEYWNLKGGASDTLQGFVPDGTAGGNLGDELWNVAKIRLKAKDGAEGMDAEGTLIIKSGADVLAVLTLTGAVGDPMIITEDIPDAVQYVPYGTMIQNSNKYSSNKISYRLTGGSLPDGMEVKPNGEIYGVPTETGEFRFTVRMMNSIDEFPDMSRTYTLNVMDNTDYNVDNSTDAGYEVTQRIPDIRLSSTEDHTFVSEGVYDEFTDIFLDGRKLTEGVDYDSESGSTRITIRSQTLKASNQTGTHTLGVEFRTREDNTLKKAAQNYRVTGRSGGTSSSGGSETTSTVSTVNDPKKGRIDDVLGVVTGEGSGYSHWQQDETGWKLIYADGSTAAGYIFSQENGESAEQIAWEKVNGSWYAFGQNGYLKSGWVYDYKLAGWYNISTETGMVTGWYKDPYDSFTYYLEPADGRMVLGWKEINGNWYYFNETAPIQSWFYDPNTGAWVYKVRGNIKPYGSLYINDRTPDNYYVDDTGAWNGRYN